MSDLRRWLTTYKGLSPWPSSVDGWLKGAKRLQTLYREAAIEAANEIGAWDLAERMLTPPDGAFPADSYFAELNRRRPGAGDLARRRAHQRLRRE